jgi:hypothetical protein
MLFIICYTQYFLIRDIYIYIEENYEKRNEKIHRHFQSKSK